jgi:small-conductance mechanosensitive channel
MNRVEIAHEISRSIDEEVRHDDIILAFPAFEYRREVTLDHENRIRV